MDRCGKRIRSRRQRHNGAAAIEFALVFPVLFFMTYGLVFYGYMFVVQTAMNYAAQQGAEAAVSVDPTLALSQQSLYGQTVCEQASQAIAEVLSFLPQNQFSDIVGGTEPTGTSSPSCRSGVGIISYPAAGSSSSLSYNSGKCTGTTTIPQGYVKVCLKYQMIPSDGSFFPRVPFPGLGEIPPVPSFLVGQASVQI